MNTTYGDIYCMNTIYGDIYCGNTAYQATFFTLPT